MAQLLQGSDEEHQQNLDCTWAQADLLMHPVVLVLQEIYGISIPDLVQSNVVRLHQEDMKIIYNFIVSLLETTCRSTPTASPVRGEMRDEVQQSGVGEDAW